MSTGTHFSRSEWNALFCNNDIMPFSSIESKVPSKEIESIYGPLIFFISQWRQAKLSQGAALKQLLQLANQRPPFIIGVAGSVAAGKSTTSRLIAALLGQQFPQMKIETLSTDHFLYPNAELQTRGIMNRKGFPESYNWELLHQVLSSLKYGEKVVSTPIYSHEVYDITGETYTIDRPDIIVLEGINVLQAGHGFRPISDWLDLKIYVDADEDDAFNWYWSRIQNLVATADQNPASYFHQFSDMSQEDLFAFAKRIWKDINAINLHENILPSRARADLILKKGPNHAIQSITIQMN